MVLEDGAQGERKEGLPFIRTAVQVCGLGLRAGEEGVRCAKQDHTGLCTHASQLMKYMSQLEGVAWLDSGAEESGRARGREWLCPAAGDARRG